MVLSRRETRGIQIVLENGVSEIEAGVFTVKSQSEPRKCYRVKLSDGKYTCECEDFLNGKKCKHIYAVTYYLC